jgi:UDP-glucose 4-epimerase
MKQLSHFYANQKVLVTGGAGFIGSHIVEQLVSYGAQVRVLDNLSSGTLSNLALVINEIDFIQGDITDYATCLHASKNCSIIFHCAALVSVPESVCNPTLCHQVNVDGTYNMLEASRQNKCQRFIFSSSSAVYGHYNQACKEELPCNPQSPYGFSKRMGELYCQQYAQSYNLATMCARYFNVFGARQKDDSPYAGVRALFKRKMLNQQPLSIYGDGKQTRDFLSVAQVAQTTIMLGAQAPAIMKGNAVNVASGTSITILELFEHLKKEFPTYSFEPQFLPAREGDIRYSAADCTKLQELIINVNPAQKILHS